MIRRTIRQRADNFLGALRLAIARSTSLDEALFGAVVGFVLAIILTFLGIFD